MPLRALHEPLRTLPHVILTGVLWETRQQFPASFTAKCTENSARHPGTCPDPFRKPRPYFMLRHAESQGDQYLSILKNPRGALGSKPWSWQETEPGLEPRYGWLGVMWFSPIFPKGAVGWGHPGHLFLLLLYRSSSSVKVLLKTSAYLDHTDKWFVLTPGLRI